MEILEDDDSFVATAEELNTTNSETHNSENLSNIIDEDDSSNSEVLPFVPMKGRKRKLAISTNDEENDSDSQDTKPCIEEMLFVPTSTNLPDDAIIIDDDDDHDDNEKDDENDFQIEDRKPLPRYFVPKMVNDVETAIIIDSD